MKKIAILLFVLAAGAISALAADSQVKGYLVDVECAREEGQRPDFGKTHAKQCLQMPSCVDSGYGVLTDDKKIIKFDKAGNAEAKKFISTLTKNNDIKVTVTGSVTGEEMTVSKIELQ
jgi:hypothetical protein